jgi:RHS repeat-associated protein
MPHLTLMQCDFNDQLSATSRQAVNDSTPETTYYVYDAGGQRVRKVTERQNGTRKNERIYFGGFENYREFDFSGTSVTLRRETLHVMDDKERIAMVETRTQGDEPGIPGQLFRYQFGNHLGSASLELDDAGQIISYEEYYTYGSTSYQAGHSQTESPKRYRYTGMERDEETGFNYHRARYYPPWLGRWISCDPLGFGDGVNLYCYARSNPVRLVDPSGTDSKSKEWREYVQAYRDSQRADARLKAFLKTKEGAAAANLAQLLAEQAALQKKHQAAEGAYAIGKVTMIAVTMAADAAAARAEESAKDARLAVRFLGGLRAIQAGSEYFIASGLAAVGAEPAAALVALHASDVAVTAGKEMWTGKFERTQTSHVLSAAASGLGASDKTAYWVGEGGDAVISLKIMTLGPPRQPIPPDPPTPRGMGGALATLAQANSKHNLLRTAVRNRMIALGIPEANAGGYFPYPTLPGGETAGFGSTIPGGIQVERQVLGAIENWPQWNAANLSTRVDAVIAHEWVEFNAIRGGADVNAAHLAALQGAAETNLPISNAARELSRTRPQNLVPVPLR